MMCAMPSSAWACEARKDMPTKTTACHPAQFECNPMTPHDLAFALLRTTLVTSVAACVAALLLAWLKVDSPRTHRVAWLLVVAQGWLLIPWTLELETLPPPPPPAVQVVEMPRAFVSMEPAEVTFVAPQPPLKKQPPAPFPIAAVSIFAWLLGAAALALIAAVRYATIVRTLPRGEAPDDSQWQREWRRELRTLSLRSSGPLPSAGRAREGGRGGYTRRKQLFARLLSPRIDFRLTTNLGPLVAFIPWRYLLLAPRPLWTALTSPERSAILRHELAHIRRRDLWKSLTFRVLALPQWFNPLVWLAARRFDEAAEWACDRLASLSPRERAGVRERHKPVPNPTTIANALLRTAELASLKRPPRTLGFLAAIPIPNRRTALARRIQRLVTPRLKEESLMKRLALPALLALVAAAQLIRIEHVAASDPPPSKGGARGGIHDADNSQPTPPAEVIPPVTSATHVNELQPHDVLTVLVDHGTRKTRKGDAERGRPSNFEISCEIAEILPNGNLSIEGHQTIIKDGKEQRISLTGEVRREAISPNRTVSSRSIAELNIDILYVPPAADAPPVVPASASTSVAPAAVPPPSAETQAILDEAKAAREAGEHDRETAALAKLPYVIEPPDILTIAYGGLAEAPARGIAPNGDPVELGGKTRFESRPTNFLVAMDGRVNLGDYGTVFVAGMTTDQAAAAIKQSLSKSLDEPHATVKVAIANSKVYYIVTKGGGLGDNVVRAPIQDNLTVLDAIAALYHGRLSPQTKMWIARPGGNGVGAETILTIEWHEITSGKSAATNYLLRAGDRLFIEEPHDDRTQSAAAEAAGEPPSTIAEQYIAPPPVAPQPADAPASITLEIHPAEGDKLRIVMPLSEGMKLSNVLVESNYHPTVDYADALIILTRKGDPAIGEVMQKAIGWDKAAGSVTADDDWELQTGDEIRISVHRPQPPIPNDGETVSVVLKLDNARAIAQRIPFKAGLTVADAIAASALPHPIDFTKVHLWLISPLKGSAGATKSKLRSVRWNASSGAPDTNYELHPGDVLRIDAAGLPYPPVAELPVGPVLPAPATPVAPYPSPSGSASAPRLVIPGEPAPPLPAVGPQPAIPVQPAPPTPAHTPAPVPGTVSADRDVFAFIQYVRASDGSMRNMCIHDKPLVDGQTVADLLRTLKLPQPVDFAKVQLTVSTPDADAPNRRVRRPIEWDDAVGQPTAETNFALQAGAVLFIDAMAPPLKADSLIPPTAGYAPQPQPQPWVPVVESPIFSPQPAPMPAPMAAPGPPAAVADGIAYKFSLLEDTSGDLVEFIGHDEPNPGAIHQTAALEPALRVLKKHGLVKTIGDPTIITQSGRPASFELGVPAVGKEKEFIARHVKIVGREAPPLMATGPQKEGRPINVEIEAHAEHAGERCTLDAAFQLVPGQSAIARLKNPDGSPSPLYLVVTPEWLE
jgi:protein involved in polysaccharide export with SLBB domain